MRKLLYLILLLITGLPLLAGELDSAFKGENGKAYFFSGSLYYRFDFDNKAVDSGYPREISGENWKGVTFPKIDAAFCPGKDEVYLFSGNRFLIFDMKKKQASSPEEINGETWPGLPFSSLDAASYLGKEKVLFILGNRFVVYDLKKKEPEKDGTLSPESWKGFPFSGADCALYHNRKVFLFSGNSYIRSTSSLKVEKDYPKKIADLWKGLDGMKEQENLSSPAPDPPIRDSGFSPAALPPLTELLFKEKKHLFLSGKGAGTPEEWLDNLGIALTFNQNNYWASNKYSARGYNASQGEIRNRKGKLLFPEVYRLSPPLFSGDHQFAASSNQLFFRFPQTERKESYFVYALLSSPEGLAEGYEKEIFLNLIALNLGIVETNGGMEKLPAPFLNRLKEATFFIITTEPLSPLKNLAKGVNGGLFADTALGKVGKFLITPERGIPYESYEGFQYGPDTVYGPNARFYPFLTPRGDAGVAWKDEESSRIYVTIFSPDYRIETIKMPESLGILGGFTLDREFYYYLTMEKGENPEILLVKSTFQGKKVKATRLSHSRDQFNVHQFGDNVVSLLYADGRLGLNMARTMQKSGDGLNHQGAIGAIFEADSLKLIHNFGQTSGHSFDSRITFDGDGFVILNLGDNYPRGIIIHKMKDDFLRGHVIYTFKTAHGTIPSPYRKGEDGKSLPPGKWSNDNYTYTELGQVHRGKNGFVVLFASEKSYRNDLARDRLNESRNLGMVLVNGEFENETQKGALVSDKVVISRGTNSPEYGFYTFDGWFSPQQSRGVIWLTDYDNEEKKNATHIKLAPLEDGTYLALWEKWTEKEFTATYGLLFDEKGNKLTDEVLLSDKIRLHRKDDLLVSGNKVIWFTGQGGKLEMNVLELK